MVVVVVDQLAGRTVAPQTGETIAATASTSTLPHNIINITDIPRLPWSGTPESAPAGARMTESGQCQQRPGSGDGTAWNLMILSSISVPDSAVRAVAGPAVRVVSPRASVVT